LIIVSIKSHHTPSVNLIRNEPAVSAAIRLIHKVVVAR